MYKLVSNTVIFIMQLLLSYYCIVNDLLKGQFTPEIKSVRYIWDMECNNHYLHILVICIIEILANLI